MLIAVIKVLYSSCNSVIVWNRFIYIISHFIFSMELTVVYVGLPAGHLSRHRHA